MEFKSVVFNAARDGKLRRLKVFLENRSPDIIKSLISPCNNGATPLVIAAKNGHLDVIEYLVKDCAAEIDQVGNVEFDGETIEGAPPLWCAAAAGHFNVVKALLDFGAYINNTTKTKSTPLRAACYDGHYEVVRYLVDNGADIEIANRHGHTCLMIACFKGHYNIAKFLIECGADINRKSVKGNTALHDCAESGSIEIMKLLIKYGAKMDFDAYGVTPLLAASLTGQTAIVELIRNSLECQIEEKISALELLGATYVDKKRDMLGALKLWRRAIRERQAFCKRDEHTFVKYTVAAYGDASEVNSLEELDELSSDPDKMRMYALLLREKILGPGHPDTTYYIRYRGAVYADTGNFNRCIQMWIYALDMQQKVLEPLSPITQSSLLSFAELFSFMMARSSSSVRFCDLFSVFQRAFCELQAAILSETTENHDSTNLNRTLVVMLHFIGLLCRLQPNLNPDEEFELKKAVYRLVRLNLRGKNGWTLLHLAVYRDTTFHSTRYPMWEFPMNEVLELLLSVGASVQSVDVDKNTALHIAALNKPLPKQVITTLLKYGSHLDARNSRGITPLQLIRSADLFSQLCSLRYLSLQCLCAQTIVENKVPYEGLVGQYLYDFIKSH
ncbi:protein fem-1 C-like protein [Leptotrombidium deliense]|uniref:Protein fem-1 C-like protein n=1 Tax=Leptotrombidium deliense TaxID=299467 RepID=A0A443SQU0_9ACAR|nr:protein fem-1 C-like protein [Leptotrombidium deliense]